MSSSYSVERFGNTASMGRSYPLVEMIDGDHDEDRKELCAETVTKVVFYMLGLAMHPSIIKKWIPTSDQILHACDLIHQHPKIFSITRDQILCYDGRGIHASHFKIAFGKEEKPLRCTMSEYAYSILKRHVVDICVARGIVMGNSFSIPTSSKDLKIDFSSSIESTPVVPKTSSIEENSACTIA